MDSGMFFSRPIVAEILESLRREPPLLQVMVGPRQVGKTTAAQQIVEELKWPAHSVTADSPTPHPPERIEVQWQMAERLPGSGPVLLVLDEVQKVPGWAEVTKKLWDNEHKTGGRIRPLLLGSSALLAQKGLTESLAGRFFLHRMMHWSWPEMQHAFEWNLDRWLYFGGYPGAAPFATNVDQWKRYVTDSLIETVIARDVLQLQTVNKPALLRHLFGLATGYPAQILSYNKMLGQLHDAGNTTTLAHYLNLLETAFLVAGPPLFTAGEVRRRASSPKLILWNNALINAVALHSFDQIRRDPSTWGRLVENAVGAHLLNHLHGPPWRVSYWRDGNLEVDFVVSHGNNTWALEVKSGKTARRSGLAAFRKRYPEAKVWLVGADGIPLEEFFSKPPQDWLT
ncbi:MAG: hypothetical protein A2341_06645 [Deltaproteobacteria bacterium RIFOXYB12_FULL_58_9]|nr:MAG: hypothetical protein A2341_06645 [Deltaproteobacteria bacterium RIFOXYB12_FULL_58_9]